jgi:cell division protein FtsL
MSTSYVNGNVAVQFEEQELAHEGRRLTVFSGSLPSPGTRPLSAVSRTALKCAVAVLAVMTAVAVCVIATTAVSFAYSAQNDTMQAELDTIRKESRELENSIANNGNLERVRSLAANVYGMVAVEGETVLDLDAAASVADDPSYGGATGSLE